VKILLLDRESALGLDEPAASYVGELAPVLAEDHRVSVLTVKPNLLRIPSTTARVRRAVLEERPDILHINNLSGAALTAIVFVINEGAYQPAMALGLHDDRLLLHSKIINRSASRSIKLVVSPSSSLLDRYLAGGFFSNAAHEVIPYGMPYHAGHLIEAYRRLLRDRRTGGLDRAA
jgi:hypothetical protein